MTGPSAPRVVDCRSAAMLIKSALRDLLSVSYGIVSTTVISHLRWLPPFGGWRHHLSPASGGTITRAYFRAAYEPRLRGVLFCPLNRGKSGAAG